LADGQYTNRLIQEVTQATDFKQLITKEIEDYIQSALLTSFMK